MAKKAKTLSELGALTNPEPEVPELNPFVIVVEKLSTADLVLQRPEPATKFQKHNGTQVVILQDRHARLLRHKLA